MKKILIFLFISIGLVAMDAPNLQSSSTTKEAAKQTSELNLLNASYLGMLLPEVRETVDGFIDQNLEKSYSKATRPNHNSKEEVLKQFKKTYGLGLYSHAKLALRNIVTHRLIAKNNIENKITKINADGANGFYGYDTLDSSLEYIDHSAEPLQLLSVSSVLSLRAPFNSI